MDAFVIFCVSDVGFGDEMEEPRLYERVVATRSRSTGTARLKYNEKV